MILEIVFLASMFLIVWSYLFYPVVLVILSLFASKRAFSDADQVPSVTLIIPAYNEEDFIVKKIDNAVNCDYPQDKLQIIVGSDCSSDRTVEAAKAMNLPNVEVMDFRERSGKMGVVNKCMSEARGDIVVLTDANALFSVDAFRRIASDFNDPSVGCVSGAKVISESDASTSKGEGLYWRFESFVKRMESATGSCSGADGALYAVRREYFKEQPVGRVIMDDFAVSLDVVLQGKRCVYDPSAKAHEGSGMLMGQEFKRKARILAGALTVFFSKPRVFFGHSIEMTFKLVSHKLLRWMGGFLLVIALGANVGILLTAPFLLPSQVYAYSLYAQGVFYGLGAIGAVTAASGMRLMPFYMPFYFLLSNFAQIYGVLLYATWPKTGAWEKLKR